MYIASGLGQNLLNDELVRKQLSPQGTNPDRETCSERYANPYTFLDEESDQEYDNSSYERKRSDSFKKAATPKTPEKYREGPNSESKREETGISLCFQPLFLRKEIENIKGREEEMEFVLSSLRSEESHTRPLLIGSEAIGKHSIIVKSAYGLQERKIIQIHCRELAVFFDADGWGSSVLSFYKVVERYLRNSRCIFYLRNINALFTQDTDKIGRLHHFFSQPHHMIATSWPMGMGGVDHTVLQTLKQFSFVEKEIKPLGSDHLQEIVRSRLRKEIAPNAEITDDALCWLTEGCREYLQVNTIRDTFQILEKAFYKAETYNKKKQRKAQGKKEKRKTITIAKRQIAEVLAERTNIPLEQILSNPLERLNFIQKELKRCVIGQQEGIDRIMPKIRLWATGLRDPEKPPGVFLIAGPTGVGKTYLAEVFQKTILPGSEDALIVINGGEYQEEGSLSKLIGTSQGYIGYGETAVLHSLRQNSHKVVLIDEIEKMHHRILDLFLAVFDKGIFQDGSGRKIDCRHTWFIATTNVGAEVLQQRNSSGEEQFTLDSWNYSARHSCLMEELLSLDERGEVRYFRQEFLARVTVVAFRTLFLHELVDVARSALEGIQRNVKKNRNIEISWDEEVLSLLSRLPFEEQMGMRSLSRVIQDNILQAFLEIDITEEETQTHLLHLTIQEGTLTFITQNSLPLSTNSL